MSRFIAFDSAAGDSLACAQTLLRYFENGADIRQYIRTCSLGKWIFGKVR